MQRVLLYGMFWLALSTASQAGPLISEIYFNPPGGNDAPTNNALEYIELCAPVGTSLSNTYLIFLENENDEFNGQNPGEVENIFDLNGMLLGSNGYLVLAMRNSAYPALTSVPFDITTPVNAANPTKAESLKTLANGAHVYQNRDTGAGYGNGATSSIGHVGQNSDIEGSGFTAMLVSVDPLIGIAPILNQDLDVGNDGLDLLPAGWSILDSIGVFGEPDETAFGRLYGLVNFGPGSSVGLPGGVEPSATYINTAPSVGEIEYVSRVGTGLAPSNWMVANLTDNAATGFTSALRNYAVSGVHASLSNPEVYVGSVLAPAPFVYGTDITVTFGADNVGFSGSHIPEANSMVLVGAAAAVVLLARRRGAKVS
jgi:hypothetical protein